jgi:ribosomal protein S18
MQYIIETLQGKNPDTKLKEPNFNDYIHNWNGFENGKIIWKVRDSATYTMLVEMCRKDRKLTIIRFDIVTLYIRNITMYGSKNHNKELHQHTIHLTKTILKYDKEVNKSQVNNMSKKIVVLKEEVQKLKEKQDELKKEQTIINTEVCQELRVQNQRITEVDNKYQEELSKMQLQMEQ